MAIDKLQVKAGPGSLVVLYGFDDEVAHWVGQQLGCNFGESRALGIGYQGELIGGCVYYNARTTGMEVAIASTSPKWCNKTVLKHLFFYPFITCECKRISSLVTSTDTRAIELNKRLGFVHEGTVRDGHPDGDAELFGMLRHECRWLNGQERRTKSAESA